MILFNNIYIFKNVLNIYIYIYYIGNVRANPNFCQADPILLSEHRQ